MGRDYMWMISIDDPRPWSRRGYSGVATYCRRDAPCLPVAAYDSLQAVDRGFFGGTDDEDDEQDGDNAIAEQRHDEASFADLDKEGRLVVTDHGLFVLFNVYVATTVDGQCSSLQKY